MFSFNAALHVLIYIGNLSSPNDLTNVLLDNLRQFTNSPQILRIGGLTQYGSYPDVYRRLLTIPSGTRQLMTPI